MKFQRQAAIVDLIGKNEIKTQEELSERLREMGFPTTQATISRDIKEMRLVKVTSISGGYKYSTADTRGDSAHIPRLKNIFRECVLRVDTAQNIVVVKTLVGMGNAAAAAIDAMKIADIVGTLAGDDTMFIAMRSNEEAEHFAETVSEMLA